MRPVYECTKLKIVVWLWLLSMVTGCASWSNSDKIEEVKTVLPVSQSTAPDSVTVDTVLVRFDEDHRSQLESIWSVADESVLDFPLRKLLDTNGVRVGVIRGELPPALMEQMTGSRSSNHLDPLEQIGIGSNVDTRPRSLACRAGRRKELVVRQEHQQQLSVFTNIDGSRTGGSFDQAAAIVAMTVFPQTDGTALVELMPEVQHGQPRTSYVTGEFGVRQEMRRESKSWKQFKMRLPLSIGNVIVLSTTTPSKGLGNAFFVTESNDHREEQVMLLIRLTATNMDDLFDDSVVEQARALMEQR